MGLFDKLTSKNFQAYALQNYDDPQCTDIEDFHEDLKRFRYLKRLLHRYHENGEMRERLMLNHVICLFNVFGYEPCMRMLDFKIKEKSYWSSIKTMLLYLGYIEENWRVEVSIDEKLAQRLREL
jgi:hypothetical protein